MLFIEYQSYDNGKINQCVLSIILMKVKISNVSVIMHVKRRGKRSIDRNKLRFEVKSCIVDIGKQVICKDHMYRK